MFVSIFYILILLKGLASLQQNCHFNSETWFIDSHNSEKLAIFWTCNIRNIKLLDDKEKVTTSTKNNTKSNDAVIAFEYYGEDIKFIPSSIFEIFKNMEYFKITDGLHFEYMKPEYLQNASKLRIFKIVANKMTKLEENLFKEAPNLEFINFSYNMIEQIHRWTFKGLLKLQGLFLEGNQIMVLHPRTFSHLLKLNDLDLSMNTCVDVTYSEIANNFTMIEMDLKISCKFDNSKGDEIRPRDSQLFTRYDQTNENKLKIEYLAQNEERVIIEPDSSLTIKNPQSIGEDAEMSQDDAELNQLKEDLQEMGHAIEILSQKMAGSEKMIQTLQKRKDSTVEIKKIEGKLVKIEEGFDERLDDITRDFSGRALSSSFRIKNLEKSLETCDKTNNDLKSSLKELEGKMEAAGKQFMNLILALQKKQAACCKSLASQ